MSRGAHEECRVQEASADSGQGVLEVEPSHQETQNKHSQETLTLIFSHLSPSVIIIHVASSQLKVVHEGGYNTDLVSGVRTQAVRAQLPESNFFSHAGEPHTCTCSS